MEKTFTVYILASLNRRLYTGITGNIRARMYRHKRGIGSEFAARYASIVSFILSTFNMPGMQLRGRKKSRHSIERES